VRASNSVAHSAAVAEDVDRDAAVDDRYVVPVREQVEDRSRPGPVDRQKALGRFRTLPWSSDFEPQRQAMGKTIEGVWPAWDRSDDEFQLAYKTLGRQPQSLWPQ